MNDRKLASKSSMDALLVSPPRIPNSLDVDCFSARRMSTSSQKGVKGRCLARIVDPESAIELWPGITVYSVKPCCGENIPVGSSVCSACFQRPRRAGADPVRRMWGLLTDSFPEGAPIYGSPWYWGLMGEMGEIGIEPPREWIQEACVRQLEAESWCPRGMGWKVQRQRAEDGEMRGGKKSNAGAATAAKTGKGIQTTLETLRVQYEESEEPLTKIFTEPLVIRKVETEGKIVWVAENGLVFACGAKDSVGDCLGQSHDLGLSIKIEEQ